jgi:hypothetical protein
MAHVISERSEIRKLSKIELTPKPAIGKAMPAEAEQPVEVKPTEPAPSSDSPEGDEKNDKDLGHLDLGGGYGIAHKRGTAYSTFYRIIAEKGHFVEVVALLEGKINVKDPASANKLLNLMMIPIDKIEEYCQADPAWKVHAERKTQMLLTRLKKGDKAAKDVLGNATRCTENKWTGNFREILSTCVGYFNWLRDEAKRATQAKAEGKPFKPTKLNKNVKKLKEAKLVIRRFPSKKGGNQPAYIMLFPEKFIPQVNMALRTAKGED